MKKRRASARKPPAPKPQKLYAGTEEPDLYALLQDPVLTTIRRHAGITLTELRGVIARARKNLARQENLMLSERKIAQGNGLPPPGHSERANLRTGLNWYVPRRAYRLPFW